VVGHSHQTVVPVDLGVHIGPGVRIGVRIGPGVHTAEVGTVVEHIVLEVDKMELVVADTVRCCLQLVLD
jgi:hypothetical protein